MSKMPKLKKITWDRNKVMHYKAVQFQEVPCGGYFYHSSPKEPNCPCLYIKTDQEDEAVSLRSGCICEFEMSQLVIPQNIHIVSRDVVCDDIHKGYGYIDYENLETHPFIRLKDLKPYDFFIFYCSKEDKNPTVWQYCASDSKCYAVAGFLHDTPSALNYIDSRQGVNRRVIPVKVEIELHVSF